MQFPTEPRWLYKWPSMRKWSKRTRDMKKHVERRQHIWQGFVKQLNSSKWLKDDNLVCSSTIVKWQDFIQLFYSIFGMFWFAMLIYWHRLTTWWLLDLRGHPLCLQSPQDERHLSSSCCIQQHLMSSVLHFGLHSDHENAAFTDQRYLAKGGPTVFQPYVSSPPKKETVRNWNAIVLDSRPIAVVIQHTGSAWTALY